MNFMDKLKQMNEARKMANIMENKMKETNLEITEGCISVKGNLKSIIEFIINDSDAKHEDISKYAIKAINKYLSESEKQKQKIMAASLGGMKGMMDMFKNFQ